MKNKISNILFISSMLFSIAGWIGYAWIVSQCKNPTLNVGVYNEDFFSVDEFEKIGFINLVSVITLFSAIIFFIISLVLKERKKLILYTIMSVDLMIIFFMFNFFFHFF